MVHSVVNLFAHVTANLVPIFPCLQKNEHSHIFAQCEKVCRLCLRRTLVQLRSVLQSFACFIDRFVAFTKILAGHFALLSCEDFMWATRPLLRVQPMHRFRHHLFDIVWGRVLGAPETISTPLMMVNGLCLERDSNPWTSDHESDALTNCAIPPIRCYWMQALDFISRSIWKIL